VGVNTSHLGRYISTHTQGSPAQPIGEFTGNHIQISAQTHK
jgi:hypothetical protein